jgi:hypothetical protein
MAVFSKCVLAVFLTSMIISANAGVRPTVSHPIRDLYRSLTKCAGTLAVWEAARNIHLKLRGRDDSYWWHTGTRDVVDLHDGPKYEAYRAHYDPRRHVVIIEQVLYEFGWSVIAETAQDYPFARADLSNAPPIQGLSIGENQADVERQLGKGYRHDECGREQHYYVPIGITIYILTYESRRLSKVVVAAAP